jgi:predicted transcriptional regulator
LKKINEELARNQQLVNKEVQEYTINNLQKDLSLWTQKRSNQLQAYVADLDKYKTEASNEKEVYAINELQKEIGLYQANQNNKLQKYQGDLARKSQKFQSEFGVWQTNVSSEFQKHQAMMGELAALQAQYRDGLKNFVASYRLPKGDKDGE